MDTIYDALWFLFFTCLVALAARMAGAPLIAAVIFGGVAALLVMK